MSSENSVHSLAYDIKEKGSFKEPDKIETRSIVGDIHHEVPVPVP